MRRGVVPRVVLVLLGLAARVHAGSFVVTSPAFADGATMPKVHTCDGEDTSPPLEWTGAPAGAKAFAVLAEDPDAPGGTFAHWVLYDLPADVARLDGAVPAERLLPNKARQGVNDFGRVGWGGPCPPPGAPHRYTVTVYALDTVTGLAPRAKRIDVLHQMMGHVLAEARLTVRYGR